MDHGIDNRLATIDHRIIGFVDKRNAGHTVSIVLDRTQIRLVATTSSNLHSITLLVILLERVQVQSIRS